MVILLEICFAELVFMLNESESKSDADLFFAVNKYLTRLYASTNCTKYVKMTTDFFLEWYCKSPAERIIYVKAVFTRKTKNGSTIFTNRLVEWMMRDIRMWMGKTGNSNHTPTLVEQCILTLAERKKDWGKASE